MKRSGQRRALHWIDRYFEEVVCGLLLVGLMLLLGAQVVLRYLFGMSISWHEEVTRLCFVWFAYFGASMGVQRQAHIRVTSFVLLLPEGVLRHAVILISDACWLFFNLAVLVVAWDFFALSWRFPQASGAIPIDVFWIQLIVAIGFAGMSLRLVQLYVRWWFGHGKRPSQPERSAI